MTMPEAIKEIAAAVNTGKAPSREALTWAVAGMTVAEARKENALDPRTREALEVTCAGLYGKPYHELTPAELADLAERCRRWKRERGRLEAAGFEL